MLLGFINIPQWMVVALYPRRTAANILDFLERLFEEMRFSIQRLQRDRGEEFFADKVQEYLKAIKLVLAAVQFR